MIDFTQEEIHYMLLILTEARHSAWHIGDDDRAFALDTAIKKIKGPR